MRTGRPVKTGTDWWTLRRRHAALGVACPVCPESMLEAGRTEAEGNADQYEGRCPRCGTAVRVVASPTPWPRRYRE